MKMPIEIGGGWLPDLNLDDIALKGGLKVAKNIMPIASKYKPLPSLSVLNSSAVSGTAIKFFVAQDLDGSYYNFLGATTKLYRFTAAALTDVTRAAGGAYTGSMWNFAEFGNWLVATNFADVPQVLKGYTTANFVALGGSPPKAKYCLMNSDHLILAHLNESGTVKPKKLVWSAEADVETFTASLLTGAGSKDFSDISGNITGLGAIGDDFIIATNKSISIGYFVGGAYTYSFKVNAYKDIGCYYPESLISIKNAVFFWDKDDIYVFDGNAPRSIGENKVRETVLQDINATYAYKMTVAHDKINGLIIWAYPSQSSAGTIDKLLIYSYLDNKFTYADVSLDIIGTGVSGGISIDELTTTSIDAVSDISIDSDYWVATIFKLMAVASSKINTFTGDSLQMEIETGEVFDMPTVFQAKKAYLPIDNLSGSGTVSVKHRYSSSVGQSLSSASSIKSDGTADLRTTNRRLALNIKAQYFISIGNKLEMEITVAGER